MSFYLAFLRALWRRPAAALEALFWHVTGRKVRARNRLHIVTAQSPVAYQWWIEHVESAQDIVGAQTGWEQRPLLSVILYDDPAEPAGQRERTLAALHAQHYRDWELVLVSAPASPPPDALDVPRLTLVDGAHDRAAALTMGITAAAGEFVLPLPGGAVLPATALSRYAQALRGAADAVVLYGDHDETADRNHRRRPWFKPRWNPEMLLAQDYISPACLIRTTAARAALPLPAELAQVADYALVLAVSHPEQLAAAALTTGGVHGQADRIVHIPHVLAHLPVHARDDESARVAAVAYQLAGSGAAVATGPFGSVRVDWPLPDPQPLVSIIIPTRDQVRLLRNCVMGVLDGTSYCNFEIIIVDNGSRAAETLTFLTQLGADPRVRVMNYDQPFNFSAINNFAARAAQGSYLCLLNNDIEIIDPDWLTALMRQAVRPHVGAVGAKLLYEDGTIQHAGVVIGLGDTAGHAHRFQHNDQFGYFARAHVAHRVSAVTAACLVVNKAKFDVVGGLDEANFPVAFNDVDLCLKLGQAGWHNIYVPQAVAIHHESKSRGRDFLPANIARYRAELAILQHRWSTHGYSDPLHHPSLDNSSETYVIPLKL